MLEASETRYATYRVAAIQMVSGEDWERNVTSALTLLEQGVAQGARLLVLPENWAVFDSEGYREFAGNASLSQQVLAALSDCCRQHGVWVCAGTVPVPSEVPGKCVSRCCLLNDRGEVVGAYDKLHLFDAEVDDAHSRYTESAYFTPGQGVQIVTTPFGKVGLAVCYDLRFPELFRWMAQQGAELFLVPSAFTRVTGQAHWSVLTRARAIENTAYVVAVNQGGSHSNGRETWGHTCVIDPWGEVLFEREEMGAGVVVVELDRSRINTWRQKMPTLQHTRLAIQLPDSMRSSS
ncbi:MAG: carbon-nitrogen hydrolase family protein [Gammaproteobacteria bacterium]